MRMFLAITICFFLVSCWPQPTDMPKPTANTLTYVPVYMADSTALKVVYEPPRPITNSGKIFTIGNYLLQVEGDSGIHVIDYTNRNAPVKKGFIKSLRCSEMSVKGSYLYINNVNDLVVLDISDVDNPKEVNRIKDAFQKATNVPPVTNVFFECPDPAKGIVVGWKTESRDYPKCYR